MVSKESLAEAGRNLENFLNTRVELENSLKEIKLLLEEGGKLATAIESALAQNENTQEKSVEDKVEEPQIKPKASRATRAKKTVEEAPAGSEETSAETTAPESVPDVIDHLSSGESQAEAEAENDDWTPGESNSTSDPYDFNSIEF